MIHCKLESNESRICWVHVADVFANIDGVGRETDELKGDHGDHGAQETGAARPNPLVSGSPQRQEWI